MAKRICVLSRDFLFRICWPCFFFLSGIGVLLATLKGVLVSTIISSHDTLAKVMAYSLVSSSLSFHLFFFFFKKKSRCLCVFY